MARRVGLPEHIRVELPIRAKAGAGHDADYPTEVQGGVVPAARACRMSPSLSMLQCVKDVTSYLDAQGATHVTVAADLRGSGAAGALTVRWNGGVPTSVVAAAFAVSSTEDGTPRIPSWLNLRADHDFDLRWQPAY